MREIEELNDRDHRDQVNMTMTTTSTIEQNKLVIIEEKSIEAEAGEKVEFVDSRLF